VWGEALVIRAECYQFDIIKINRECACKYFLPFPDLWSKRKSATDKISKTTTHRFTLRIQKILARGKNKNFWKYLRRLPAFQCINKYGKLITNFGLIFAKFGSNYCELFFTNLESESIKMTIFSHCTWTRNFVVVKVRATKDPQLCRC
jgi:hypothetical protein